MDGNALLARDHTIYVATSGRGAPRVIALAARSRLVASHLQLQRSAAVSRITRTLGFAVWPSAADKIFCHCCLLQCGGEPRNTKDSLLIIILRLTTNVKC